MQRAPAMIALLLFVALCASLAYWLLQWITPEPRAVAAPPEAAQLLPSVSAAASLFGGRPQTAGGAQVQLRGILRAGRASVAIIAADGKPARALPMNAEVLPGLTVKEIGARTVVLSERGAERELALPAFSAQEGGATVTQLGTAPEPQLLPPQTQPSAPPPSPAPNSPQPQPSGPQLSPSSSVGASAGGRGDAGKGGDDAVADGAAASAQRPPNFPAPSMPRRSPPSVPTLR